jgi:3-oxoadipate enol-lactonase
MSETAFADCARRVGPVTLHIRDEGLKGGRPVVFANSLGTDLRIWRAVIDRLPATLRFVRYDKRGHGLSDCPDGPYAIADHAGDLAGLLDALGVRGAVVCGLSVGGLIAQKLAADRPDLVSALILCDTAAKIGTADLWNQRIGTVRVQGIAPLADAILERWFTPGFRAAAPDFPVWRNMLTRTPAEGYAATCEAIRDADLTESTRALRLPTLAMVGAQDGSTPPDLVKATADLIPGARFEVIEDCGHIPCVEQAERTAALIRGFIAELPTPAAA